MPMPTRRRRCCSFPVRYPSPTYVLRDRRPAPPDDGVATPHAARRFSRLVAPSCGRYVARTARRFVDARMYVRRGYVHTCRDPHDATRVTRTSPTSPTPHDVCLPPPSTVTRVLFCSFACESCRVFYDLSLLQIYPFQVNSFHNQALCIPPSVFYIHLFKFIATLFYLKITFTYI